MITEPFQGRKKLILVLAAVSVVLILAGSLLTVYVARRDKNTTQNNSTVTANGDASPTATPAVSSTPVTTPTVVEKLLENPVLAQNEVSSFYRAINLGGKAVTFDNHLWEDGLTKNERFTYEATVIEDNTSMLENFAFRPAITDPNRVSMMRSLLWHGGRPQGAEITMSQIENGKYWVFVYVFEETAPTTFNIYLNNKLVAEDYNSGQPGDWRKFGPLPVQVMDGTIKFTSTGGDTNFSGIELYRITTK
jgi:hypothetical protein